MSLVDADDDADSHRESSAAAADGDDDDATAAAAAVAAAAADATNHDEKLGQSVLTFLRSKNGPRKSWFFFFCNDADDDDGLMGSGRRRRLRRRRRFQILSRRCRGGGGGEKPYQKLVTDERVFQYSLNSLRLAVFADCINGMILQPNYAIMASSDTDEESFESTHPFDFNSATYFIPMTAMLGMALSSILTGRLSDKMGRKPIILFCLLGGMMGSAWKWSVRSSFWAFCMANFISGFISSGTLPVALAYVSDVFAASRSRKGKELGYMIGFSILGQSCGGIIAILMDRQGLFAPLWIGVAIMSSAFLINWCYLIEPGSFSLLPSPSDEDRDDGKKEQDDDDGKVDEQYSAPPPLPLPREVDYPKMIHILSGALADTIGSKGLFPLCLSPLAFDQFYRDFLDDDNDGDDDMTTNKAIIMSLNAYKWLTVLVSLIVIPSTFFTPIVFNRMGLAGGCVLGNIITGIVTIILLVLGSIEPTSKELFFGFIVFLYIGYPFTVISQLSTSPMLDLIAPLEKRGYIQGMYTTILNVGNAISPWILGLLADAAGTRAAISSGICISFFAALINSRLTCHDEFGPKSSTTTKKTKTNTNINSHKEGTRVDNNKKDDDENENNDDVDELGISSFTDEEEEEYARMVSRGEYVPMRIRDGINRRRSREGRSLLFTHESTFARDKPRLGHLRRMAKDDFTYLRDRAHVLLTKLHDDDDDDDDDDRTVAAAVGLPRAIREYNASLARIDPRERRIVQDEIGNWFADYLADAGYSIPATQSIIKLMILRSFPPLIDDGEIESRRDGELTVDNFEETIVRMEGLYDRYMSSEEEEKKKKRGYYTVFGILRRPIRRWWG